MSQPGTESSAPQPGRPTPDPGRPVLEPTRPATDPGSPVFEPDRPSFAHASEAEFARILDFYAVRWLYEPHTFPILWSLDGSVLESFSPDFWLPDLELYVELTTLKQSLVRKKNRKLRRLRELYPDVRIKLFYGRDFRALMLKYGKLGLIGEMSGAPGQAAVEERVILEPPPQEASPVERAPVELPPVEPAPVEPAPVEPAPVEPAPVEPAPVAATSEVPKPSASRRRRRGSRAVRRPSVPP